MSVAPTEGGLGGLLSECGAPPAVTSSLILAGWTLETFAACSDSMSGFDTIWQELLPDHPAVSLLEKSAIRAAWRRLHQTPAPTTQPAATPSASSSEGSWNELPAPASVLADLKRAFFTDFPSEVLSPDTCPSSRLIALTHSQVQKQDIHWVPWKFRMSQQRMEDIQMARPFKMAKADSTSLHQLLWDEPPSIEVGNQSMGLNGIRCMLELANTSYALVQATHKGRLRAYSVKFMSLISSCVDNDLGLRHVTAFEAQAADRHLWGIMHDLMVDKGWTLNDCLHEITTVRSDMMSLLQPRPRAASRCSDGPASQQRQGQIQGEDEVPKFSQRPQMRVGDHYGWYQTFHLHAFPVWQVYESELQIQTCCAHPKYDGSACGGQHSAKDHANTPH